MGQDEIITVPSGVTRVAIGDSSIVNVSLIQDGTGKTLLIEAKKPGITNFLVWPNNGPVQNYLIEVLTSRRPESVAIRVKVLEVTGGGNGDYGVGWAQQLKFAEAPPAEPFALGMPVRDSVLNATLNMLLQSNKAKLLAQPTLVTMNGQTAKFLSGGEIPVIVATANSAAVEWKTYGVTLDVTPTIEGADDIVLNLKPGVSTLDKTNGVVENNFTIPAIATRTADTTVTLKSGESIVLAGLLQDNRQEVKTMMPILGQIPILGALFTETTYQDSKSQLVISVTPSIVENNQVEPEQDYGKEP
ncbi:MAG: pilus assembly protein N-terminal domain-containing protein [Cyanobacteria bacterium REEB65]|nr:pilus assembly protein N-terminal domain-containing protein [Cyanobacteria bacterium REEB65]